MEDIFGDSNRQATYADLQKLSYLDRCVKESLRLYPSVPIISRLASKEIHTFTGYRIPKNTHVHIHIYDLHHNPDVFPNPEKFDPDRFLPENCVKRHPFAYLPFSGGPRNCIGMFVFNFFNKRITACWIVGQRFALLEVKSLISGILRKYKLTAVDTPETITMYQDIILRPKDCLKIKFDPRSTM